MHLIRGQAPTHHVKQLALYGALELLSNDRFHDEISVGNWGGGGRSTPGGGSTVLDPPPKHPSIEAECPTFQRLVLCHS